MLRSIKGKVTSISSRITVRVRFSETDAMGVVWHGSYMHFMEDARAAFGQEHKLGFQEAMVTGLWAPVVNVRLDYKQSLYYGDGVEVEIRFVDTPAAKLVFAYTIRNLRTGQVAAEAESTQVFIRQSDRQLILSVPDFLQEWKKGKGLCAGCI